ncbi:hypothetical protein C9I57_11325 [Trinickia symbiotica]|uniref:Uncharacterized protein n=1 Tax=Trinickia symbiotica TaxID=863227 RepID=A0A2T3XVD6_9BURK|nr:hypothetical protein [Trinickia symbiotica]PTB20455.1 hypothetical protein C9I57_11325 [Trinickia symbiotica]
MASIAMLNAYIRPCGIDFIQQCDSNYFYSTNISTGISTGTWFGVRFNDGTNSTTQDNDVNEEYFSGLTISGGGSGSTSYGLDINYAFDILVDGYRESSSGGTWSQLAIGGPASIASYKITNLTAPLITQYAAPAPTVTAGSAAGSSPPAPTINGNTPAGMITFGTDTSPTSGTQVNATFPTPLPATPKSVVLTPNNGSTYGLNLVPGSISSTGFVLFAINAPAASQSSTAYAINYASFPDGHPGICPDGKPLSHIAIPHICQTIWKRRRDIVASLDYEAGTVMLWPQYRFTG